MIPEMVALFSFEFVFQYHNFELKIEPLVNSNHGFERISGNFKLEDVDRY